MSYRTGTMGVAEGSAMVFILLLPRVTMNSFTMAIAKFGQLSWLYILINGLDVLAIAGMLLYVYSKEKGDIYAITTSLFGKKIACLVMLVLTLVFFFNAILLARQYAENTIITALPEMDLSLSLLLYTIGGLFTGYLGISGVTRCSVIFMPFMIATLLCATLLLFPYYIPYQLLPWQGYGIAKCMVQGIMGAGYNVGFLTIFILAPAFQNTKTIRQSMIRGIASSVLLKGFVMVVFLMVFGVSVGSEKSMPFFELARLIYLNRFFQHIEALFIVAWVILGTLAIAINLFIATYLLGRMLNLPIIRPVMPCLTMLMTSLALLPENITQVVMLDNNLIYFDDIAVYVIPILLFIATLSKQMKGTLWEKST
jgi:spore germination protein KB